MNKRESGFTLIELMIVIAIIAIIAAIAIPNLLAAKVSSNETAAIATLRNLNSSQAQLQTSGKIDVDADGIGEFGTFSELTGIATCRTTSATTVVGGTKLSPAILSPSLSNVDTTGFVTKAGYAFMIFLPAASAAFSNEKGPALTFSFTAAVDNNLAETTWCSYAQPVAHGNSGNRRFMCNQTGDTLQSANDGLGGLTKFAGTTTAINGNSAFANTGGGLITGAVAIGTKGKDGYVWKVTN